MPSSSFLEDIERDYLGEIDWEVKENANETRSFGNYLSYILDKVLKTEEILAKVFPPEAVAHHFGGYIHIHKLPHSLYIPYCVGWNFARILQAGLKTPTIVSKPAKHLDTAIAQLVNFIFMTAQEWSGAMATTAFDLYCAPFVAVDKLSDRQIKQALQDMCFELNYPSRMGFQSPFSNITIMLDTVESFLDMPAIIGGKPAGKLGDYIDEAIRVTRQLISLYNEGDRVATPFTFPIPTIFITKNFDWNGSRWGELTDELFENLAKRGTFYLLNGYSTNVEVLYSMCCRLTIDMSKLMNNNSCPCEGSESELSTKNALHGIWAIPDATGSIGVVTINLPRLAYLSKGDQARFEELLTKELELARDVLKVMRERYNRSMKVGLMPMTRLYLGTLDNHFGTFGVIGLPEAAANFLGNTKLWEELEPSEVRRAVEWMKEVVRFIRRYAEQASEADGVLYNVEEVPGESTGYKLAIADRKEFKEAFERGELCMPANDGSAFYSNSIIPYYAPMSIAERAKYEAEVQQEFTGGVMMHIFFHESPDPKALKRVVEKLAKETRLVYFSITPTISQCKRCGWSEVGIYETCPKCGKETDIWSRIVGYYRPIRSWNVGKRLEFKLRKTYGASGVKSLA